MLTLNKIFPITFLILLIVSIMLLPPMVSGIAMAVTLLGSAVYFGSRLPTETFKYLVQFCGQFLGLLFVIGVFSGGIAMLSSMMLA